MLHKVIPNMDSLTRINLGSFLLDPLRHQLEAIEIHNPNLARLLCKLIPARCPFEKDISVLGNNILHIPPLCRLNPLYEQLVELRFKSLTYLVDECGDDVALYF